jgi:hypothetical protein
MTNTGNAYLIPKRFPFQSYFSSTALEKAILTQAQGQQIIATTLQTTEMKGRAIGLHPDSECPIAVRFRLDANSKETSGVFILTPGMVITPNPGQDFSAVQWGLPFGWLGGGVAALQIFQGVQGYSAGRKKEVIFHKQRLLIAADANPPPAVAKNLPIAFPWMNAKSYTATNPAGFAQGGEQAINVTPTRMVMRLIKDLGQAIPPPGMRMIFRGLYDFDCDAGGASWSTATLTYVDVTWPLNLGTSVPYPVMEIGNPAAAFGGPDAGLTLLDLSGGDLTNVYVDLVRYGEI